MGGIWDKLPPVLIQENIPLAPLTTFKVGGPARYFVEARTEDDVRAAIDHAQAHALPLFVLGGGSNLVVADRGFPGLVLRIGLRGIEERQSGGKLILEAAAGEDWDRLVERAVAHSAAGIECLSGIPGTVGGTPVQNVGAYGQEVAETITQVRVLDTRNGQIRELSNTECGFKYRGSIFNSSDAGRYVVLRVRLALQPGGAPRIEYADLKRHFAGKAQPSLLETREAVRQIRLSKAMLLVEGDDDCRSAGSFFKNPVVERDAYEHLDAEARARGVDMPGYPATHGRVKLAAAWLVEQAGFHKGYTRGPVGISRRHALAIVNRGGATAVDIVALKDEIQKRVAGRFGIELQPEPVFVGF